MTPIVLEAQSRSPAELKRARANEESRSATRNQERRVRSDASQTCVEGNKRSVREFCQERVAAGPRFASLNCSPWAQSWKRLLQVSADRLRSGVRRSSHHSLADHLLGPAHGERLLVSLLIALQPCSHPATDLSSGRQVGEQGRETVHEAVV